MLLIDLGIVWIFIMEGGFDALVTLFLAKFGETWKGFLRAKTKFKMKVSLFA